MLEAARRMFRQKPLDTHILDTYEWMRAGMGVLAFLFPFLLFGIGKLFGIGLQPSMSAYYFAGVDGPLCVYFPIRGLLVGVLCAICFCLYLYRGFDRWENWLLDGAAIAGFLIAFIPDDLVQSQVASCEILRPISEAEQGRPHYHDWASVAMFVFLGLVSAVCSTNTLSLLPPDKAHLKKVFLPLYRGLGVAMIAALFVAWYVKTQLTWEFRVFVMEVILIELFAAYWLVKTAELRISKADRLLAKYGSYEEARVRQNELHPQGRQAL